MTPHCLYVVRGALEHLRSDNGPDLVAKEIQKWPARARMNAVHPEGKPLGERVRGDFQRQAPRRELNRELFLRLPEARAVLD